MSATKSKKLNKKLTEATEQAKDNPYLNKIIEDKELRENAVAALASVRAAFDRANEKGWDKNDLAEIVHDKKLRKDLKQAAAAAKQTKNDLTSAGKKKRHPLRKLIALTIIGAIVALVVSDGARKTVLDALFGAEEEFEYTSNVPAGTSTNGAS